MFRDSLLESRPRKVYRNPVVNMSNKTAWVLYLTSDGKVRRTEEYWGRRTPSGIKARLREEEKKGNSIKIIQFVGYNGSKREVVDVMTGEKFIHPADAAMEEKHLRRRGYLHSDL